jgi:outer membrane protein
MKKLLKVALVAVCFLTVGNFAKAQTKIGYVNTQLILSLMPEVKTVKSQLDIYQKQFIDELTSMNNELQTKGKQFQAGQATMTDAVRSSKQGELQDIQKRIQDYQNDAQQKYEAKSNELIKPLSDKIHTAVEAVAKEKGYTYVLDSGQTALVVAPDADNLEAAVKAKLGIK